MAAKKQVKVSGEFNPWWTEEAIGTLSKYTGPNGTVVPAKLYSYNNSEYLPFYTLRSEARDISYRGSFDFSLDKGYPRFFKDCKNKVNAKFLRALWDEKRYSEVITLWSKNIANQLFSPSVQVQNLKYDYNHTTSTAAPFTTPYIVSNRSVTGALNIIEAAKLGLGPGLGNINPKVNTIPLYRRPEYLFDRYFLAHMPQVSNVGETLPTDCISDVTLSTEMTKGFRPLFSLMFKKEYYHLLHAYRLLNKPVDSSLLELWVDESIMNDSSLDPIKLQVIRKIIKPCEKAGVKIVTYSNLGKQMFTGMSLPSFKSIKDQKSWQSELVTRVLGKERTLRGLVKNVKPREPKNPPTIVSNPSVNPSIVDQLRGMMNSGWVPATGGGHPDLRDYPITEIIREVPAIPVRYYDRSIVGPPSPDAEMLRAEEAAAELSRIADNLVQAEREMSFEDMLELERRMNNGG